MAKGSVESINFMLAKAALLVSAVMALGIYLQPTLQDLARDTVPSEPYGDFIQSMEAIDNGLVSLVSWVPAYQVVVTLTCLASIVWLLVAHRRDVERTKPVPQNYAAVPTKPPTEAEKSI